jgi:hypothetical protein
MLGLIAFGIAALVIIKANKAMDDNADPVAWGWLIVGSAVLLILGSLIL